ncbi:MAG TPA: DUF485 domain-containing protein [Planctomycetaceae bacterium]|nr:DUF485 domain-containing protein [Planctomycetaceae bacterium]
MAGFDHGPNRPDETELPGIAARNSRYGLVLFAVYLLLYGGFVFLNAFAPEQMERTPLAGVNLAILYGFALIAAAFLLALVYGWLCRAQATDGEFDEDADDEEGRP